MSSTRLTIGMPVRNGAVTLKRAIDSLLSQTFRDFDLVISDNDSSDATESMCMSYAASDSRVKYVRQAQNIGHQSNFDYVAEKASSEYFMWASADDYWYPEFAELLVTKLDDFPDLIAATGSITRIEPDGTEIDTVRFPLLNETGFASRTKLAIRIAAGYSNRERYHLLLYSVFRLKILRLASGYSALPTVYPDRTFMCQFSLAGRIGYLDQPIMLKTYQHESLGKRYPEEPFGKGLLNDPWALLKSSLITLPFLIRSAVVPKRYKIIAVIVTSASLWGYRHEWYRGNSPLVKLISMPYRKIRRIGATFLRRKST